MTGQQNPLSSHLLMNETLFIIQGDLGSFLPSQGMLHSRSVRYPRTPLQATAKGRHMPEVEMIGVVKWFGGVMANDHVDFCVNKGEIRALVGENGAGKTTLMRILFGLLPPDAGEIKVRGLRVEFKSPREAIAHGIGMVHQHFMLFENLSVAENVIYGMEPSRLGFLDNKRAEASVRDIAQRYGLKVDPRARVRELCVGERQRVEILKLLYRSADVLILDEPTALLTPQERDDLFGVLRELAAQQKTIILITHKLNEVMAIADTATVLRHGQLAGNVQTSQSGVLELARLMVGREVLLDIDKPPVTVGSTVLKLEDVTLGKSHERPVLDHVNLEVLEGEIVGLAGVSGNGQTELVDVLIGWRPVDAGRILIDGRDYTRSSIGERRHSGLAYIPDDRYRRGLAVQASVEENLAMGFQYEAPVARSGMMQAAGLHAWAGQRAKDYDIVLSDTREPASNLSGGNLQKVVVAREFSHKAKLILADQPTRGVDISATEFIRHQLVQRRNSGAGILLISADLDEILALADRILVIYEGRIVASVPVGSVTEEELGLMMGGVCGETHMGEGRSE